MSNTRPLNKIDWWRTLLKWTSFLWCHYKIFVAYRSESFFNFTRLPRDAKLIVKSHVAGINLHFFPPTLLTFFPSSTITRRKLTEWCRSSRPLRLQHWLCWPAALMLTAMIIHTVATNQVCHALRVTILKVTVSWPSRSIFSRAQQVGIGCRCFNWTYFNIPFSLFSNLTSVILQVTMRLTAVKVWTQRSSWRLDALIFLTKLIFRTGITWLVLLVSHEMFFANFFCLFRFSSHEEYRHFLKFNFRWSRRCFRRRSWTDTRKCTWGL